MCAGNKMKTEWMEERQKRKCRFAKRKGQAAAAAIHGGQLGIKKKKKKNRHPLYSSTSSSSTTTTSLAHSRLE